MPNPPMTHRPGLVNVPTHNPYGMNQAAYNRQAKRYMPTNSASWRKLRALVLKAEPLCRECKHATPPRYVPATHVDHINGDASKAESYLIDNLQPLCKHHHSEKTARHDGGFGNGRAGGGV